MSEEWRRVAENGGESDDNIHEIIVKKYMQYGIWVHFELCAGVQFKAVADTLSPIFLCQLSHFHLIL